jgi:hypothetical protein
VAPEASKGDPTATATIGASTTNLSPCRDSDGRNCHEHQQHGSGFRHMF